MNNCNYCCTDTFEGLGIPEPSQNTSFSQYQTIGFLNTVIADGENIPFDTLIASNNPEVTYNSLTRTFTVTASGVYLINYYVNIVGTESAIDIQLILNGIPTFAVSNAEGQVVGFAAVNLNIGDTITLKNATGSDISIGGAIQAGILITKI